MAVVVLEGPEPNGLATMIAGLLEANIAQDPAKARLVESMRGAAEIDVPDTGVTIGLKFVPGTVTVTSGAVAGAELRIRANADTVLELSTVPLRFGLPDMLTDAGRDVTAKVLRRELTLGGLPLGLPLMTKLNRLLNVNA
jgi:hypothetical protein